MRCFPHMPPELQAAHWEPMPSVMQCAVVMVHRDLWPERLRVLPDSLREWCLSASHEDLDRMVDAVVAEIATAMRAEAP